MNNLEKITRKGGKILAGVALVVALAGACRGDPESPPPVDPPENPSPIENQAPETTITKDFGGGLTGMVDYIVCGDDSDGYVDHIETWENGVYSQDVNTTQANPFCETFEVPIIEGTNTLEARANDDDGLRDPSIAEEVFDSPTEAEARAVIDGILNARGYVEDPSLTPGTYSKNQFHIVNGNIMTSDYFFTRTDGSRAIINYGGHQENLNTEINNKSILDNAIPNFTKIRVSMLESEINSFLDANIY